MFASSSDQDFLNRKLIAGLLYGPVIEIWTPLYGLIQGLV